VVDNDIDGHPLLGVIEDVDIAHRRPGRGRELPELLSAAVAFHDGPGAAADQHPGALLLAAPQQASPTIATIGDEHWHNAAGHHVSKVAKEDVFQAMLRGHHLAPRVREGVHGQRHGAAFEGGRGHQRLHRADVRLVDEHRPEAAPAAGQQEPPQPGDHGAPFQPAIVQKPPPAVFPRVWVTGDG
jgi:hypothetical protein